MWLLWSHCLSYWMNQSLDRCYLSSLQHLSTLNTQGITLNVNLQCFRWSSLWDQAVLCCPESDRRKECSSHRWCDLKQSILTRSAMSPSGGWTERRMAPCRKILILSPEMQSRARLPNPLTFIRLPHTHAWMNRFRIRFRSRPDVFKKQLSVLCCVLLFRSKNTQNLRLFTSFNSLNT